MAKMRPFSDATPDRFSFAKVTPQMSANAALLTHNTISSRQMIPHTAENAIRSLPKYARAIHSALVRGGDVD